MNIAESRFNSLPLTRLPLNWMGRITGSDEGQSQLTSRNGQPGPELEVRENNHNHHYSVFILSI